MVHIWGVGEIEKTFSSLREDVLAFLLSAFSSLPMMISTLDGSLLESVAGIECEMLKIFGKRACGVWNLKYVYFFELMEHPGGAV